jgi:hypothetical protein
MARRAAQLGGGPSGAFIKQEQLAMDASAQRLGEANEAIDAAKAGEMRRIREMEEGMNFQREEAGAQRTFQSGEREASQKFAAGESAMARALQEAGLTGTYNGTSTMAKAAMDQADAQQGLENKINTGTTVATLMGNLKTLGYTPDQVRSLVSDLGLGSLPGINIGDIPGVTSVPSSAGSPPGGGPATRYINGMEQAWINGEWKYTGNKKEGR